MSETPHYGTPPPHGEPARPGAQPAYGSPPAYGTPPVYGAPPGPHGAPPPAQALVCPKCRASMRTYERNGVHIDQCEGCRGIFLDFGELESLLQLESRLAPPQQQHQPAPQYQQAPPPGYYGGPAWGHHGSYHYRKGGLSRLFFSS